MLKTNKIKLFFLAIIFIICGLYFIPRANKHNGKTFIVGIDGLDPEIMQELIKSKRMPNFEYIIQNGAFGIHDVFDIDHEHISSPVIWTSLATGMHPERHGITMEMMYAKHPEKDIAFFAPSFARREPAIWNIFSDYHKKVAVINWWITYPSEKVNGFMVSNLISDLHRKFAQKFHNSNELNIKSISRLTYPESLLSTLLNYANSPEYNRLNKEEAGIFDKILTSVQNQDLSHDPSFKIFKFSVRDLVDFALKFDRSSLGFTKYLLDRHKNLDLITVYFEGVDIFSHMFLGLRDPDMNNTLEAKYSKFYGHMVDDYYVLMDSYIGQILQHVGDGDVLIICSDHGFAKRNDCPKQLEEGNVRTGGHRPEGMAIFYGKHIKKNVILKYGYVSLLDILPTVLYLKGMPISRKLEGKILFDCIEDGFIKETKIILSRGYRKHYDEKEAGISSDDYPFRDSIEERLRSLGYLN